MMYLERTIDHNGYFCSCCGDTWENAEWVPEYHKDTFEMIVKKAIEIRDHCTNREPNKIGLIWKQYERDGEVLYAQEIS